MNQRTISEMPSETAKGVAYLRAIGSTEENPAFACNDPYAQLFLGSEEKSALKKLQFDAVKRFWMEKHALPGSYEYLVARTKLMDRVVLEAIDAGFEQVVILGAGYDSRAIRFSQKGSSVRFIEVDAAHTQKRKKKYLQNAGVQPEDLPEFLEIDFNRQTLLDVMQLSSFSGVKKTLFLWEGVSMYLDERAVLDLLASLKTMMQAEARLVFDYIYAETLQGCYDYYGAKASLDYVCEKGEPYTFGIAEGGVDAFLTQQGYALIENFNPGQLQTLFLTDSDGNSLGRPHGFFAVAIAGL